MLNMTLTEDGRRHMTEYLNDAISMLDELINNNPPQDVLGAIRARERLEKVRLLMSIDNAVQLPSNAATIRHDAPEDLPF